MVLDFFIGWEVLSQFHICMSNFPNNEYFSIAFSAARKQANAMAQKYLFRNQHKYLKFRRVGVWATFFEGHILRMGGDFFWKDNISILFYY